MPIRSYVRFTDYHRKPCGENILCGVDVSVVVRPTFGTIPLSDIKRHFLNDVTAVSTTFGTGEPTVNFYQCPTVPLALIFQLTNQFRPRSISNCLSQFMVLCAIRAPLRYQHIPHRQILDSNRLVFAYQSSGQLVKEVCSRIGNSRMDASNLMPRFLSMALILRSL
jgi:hypothetical protein